MKGHGIGSHRRSSLVVLAAVGAVGASLGVLVLGATASVAAPATVGPTSPNIFVACGYNIVTVGAPPSCPSLSDAITAAQASGADATIEMLPGDYCPIDITNGYHDLEFVGIGQSAYSSSGGVTASNPPEAATTTMRYESAYCGSSAPNATVTVENYGAYAHLGFRNLTIDGQNPSGTSTGVTNGMVVYNANMTLRDVIIENNNAAGLVYDGGANDAQFTLEQSAVLGNTNAGVSVIGNYSAIIESTLAGNGNGVELTNGYLHLYNDTISHNAAVGVDMQGSSTTNVTSTIVAANTGNDCVGGTWESDDSVNGHNLVGSTCPRNRGNATGDLLWNGTTIAAVADTNPTPSIISPLQGYGAAANDGLCAGIDQLEGVKPTDSCDIGSVDHRADATSTADVSDDPTDFGEVHSGDTETQTVSVDNSAGGMIDIHGVSVSGAGFSIESDTCSYAVLESAHPEYGNRASSCSVVVAFTPTTTGAVTGSLTFDSWTPPTLGPIALTGEGLPPWPTALTVNRLDDPVGAGSCPNDPCSLRQAIATIKVGGTLTLPAGAYTLAQGQLLLDRAVTIDGAGARTTSITQSSTPPDRVVEVDDQVTLAGVTLTGGHATNASDGGNDGGGVLLNSGPLILDQVAVRGNTADGNGGGIEAGDLLTLDQSTASGNTAGNDGGGIDGNGEVDATNSTIANNASDGGGGGLNVSAGTLVNDTIAGNSATGAGGGLEATSVSREEIARARVAPHSEEGSDTGVAVMNTLFTGNTSGDTADSNCDGALSDLGGNLDSGTACRFGTRDQSDSDPKLGPLSDNGGQTDTMLPGGDSPVIDTGVDDQCPNVDQRGISRPQGSHCDIGAVEIAEAAPVTTPPPAPTPPATTTPPAAFVATGPTRVLDTRDGTGAPKAQIGPGGTITLTAPNLPPGTTAVVLNLTGTNLIGVPDTFVSACPLAQPLADCTKTSALNAVSGVDIANEIVVPVGPDGKITLYNNAGNIDLVADLVGYQTRSYTATGPVRVLDTRIGTGAPKAKVEPKGTLTLTVPDLPAGATAVVLNLTGTHLAGTPTTFVSACPAAETPVDCTATSALNAVSGVDIANEITVPVGPDGKITLYNNAGSIDLVADLVGYQTGSYTATGPVRVLDTRIGTGAPKAQVGPQGTLTLTVPGLPAGTTAVVLNLTAAGLDGASNTHVSACPTAQPLADCTMTSALNVEPGVDIANEITVPVGPDGKVILYNNAGGLDLVADLAGYRTGAT